MIAPLIAAIMPLLPTIIGGIESIFAAKPKSGEEKMSTVIAMVQQLSDKLLANGVIQQKADDSVLQGIIETVLAQMKTSGTLSAPLQPVGALYLLQGKVTQLKEA